MDLPASSSPASGRHWANAHARPGRGSPRRQRAGGQARHSATSWSEVAREAHPPVSGGPALISHLGLVLGCEIGRGGGHGAEQRVRAAAALGEEASVEQAACGRPPARGSSVWAPAPAWAPAPCSRDSSTCVTHSGHRDFTWVLRPCVCWASLRGARSLAEGGRGEWPPAPRGARRGPAHGRTGAPRPQTRVWSVRSPRRASCDLHRPLASPRG